MGVGHNGPSVESHMCGQRSSKGHLGSLTVGSKILKNRLFSSRIFMGLGHNDPWVDSHISPFTGIFTMIAKVCDRESRRDSWFEMHDLKIFTFKK